MIDPNDEKALRLVGFVVGLAAIVTRGDTRIAGDVGRYPLPDGYVMGFITNPSAVLEARCFSDAIVEEAKRLRAENEKSKREGE